MKKFASLLLALVIVLSLATPAFAADNGTITINDSTVSVAGKTFKAYRILELSLDATDQHHAYTVPAELKEFYKDYAWPEKKDTEGNVVPGTGKFTETELNSTDLTFAELVYLRLSKMANNSQDLYEFATAALTAAKNAKMTPVEKTGSTGATSLVFDNLSLGYYLVEDTAATTPVSALILDTTSRDVTVKIKADKPTLDKSIDGNTDTDADTSGKVDKNTAAIGDKVPFVIDTAVPDMTGYALYEKYYFVITDTLSAGLTLNDDIAIKIVHDDEKSEHDDHEDITLVKDTHYTVSKTTNSETGITELEIVFTDFYKKWKDHAHDQIIVTYSANLNEKAEIGDAGNKNTANLTYSNNPNVQDDGTPGNPNKPDGDSPVGETPDSDTYTYVTELIIEKVNENGQPLTGAEFTVEGTTMNTILVSGTTFTEDANGTYYLLKNGTYTTTAPVTEVTDHLYDSTTTKYTKTESTTVVTKPTANNANKVLYTVTVNEDGNLTLTGLQQGTYTITETKSPAGYNMLKSPITITIDWVAPTGNSTTCDWTYTLTAGGDASDSEDDNVQISNNTINKVTVVNKAGMELPSTGGMGTTLFYIIGAGLMLAAAVLLVTKKRMSDN